MRQFPQITTESINTLYCTTKTINRATDGSGYGNPTDRPTAYDMVENV